MEEFDISRMIRAIIIIIDMIANVVIAIMLATLRDSITPYISYSISLFLNVFNSLPIFNNSIANQTLYNAYFVSQIIYVLFGAIPPALGIASFMTKLSSFMTKLLGYWSDFEENPSKAIEFALLFMIGFAIESALLFISFIFQLIILIAD
jgi:hypothetical protein